MEQEPASNPAGQTPVDAQPLVAAAPGAISQNIDAAGVRLPTAVSADTATKPEPNQFSKSNGIPSQNAALPRMRVLSYLSRAESPTRVRIISAWAMRIMSIILLV